MSNGSTLLLFAGASLGLLAFPGPAVIYVVTRSVDQGRRAGLISVLGVETGTFTYAIAGTAGLSGLLAASVTAFTAVKYGVLPICSISGCGSCSSGGGQRKPHRADGGVCS